VSQLTLTFQYKGETLTGTIDVPTARIPELAGNLLPYDGEDLIALYDFSRNATVNTRLSDFRDYVVGAGEGGGVAPILQGADLEIVITAGMAGQYRVNVPALIGKTYTLNRRSVGPLTTSEFLALPSGGFELTGVDENGDHNDLVQEGEVFVAHIYELATSVTTNNNVASFINGIANITESTDLTPLHFRKLLHVVGGANKIVITLPDVSQIPEQGLIIPIETNISNQKQTRVVTKNGQSIYFNNTSQTELYLGIASGISLLANSDGWYVMPGFSDDILNVGKPTFDYVQRLNTEVARGQLVNREDVPRLMQFLTENPSLMVTEDAWQNTRVDANLGTGTIGEEWVYPLRGKFSSANGTTQIRFPDLQDLAFAGLKNIGGYDPDRSNNTTGVIQQDMIRKHKHKILKDEHPGKSDNANDRDVMVPGGNGEYNYTDEIGGSKTRMANVGFLPLIGI